MSVPDRLAASGTSSGRRAGHQPCPVQVGLRVAGAFADDDTGELLRKLTLDPTRNYQPQQ